MQHYGIATSHSRVLWLSLHPQGAVQLTFSLNIPFSILRTAAAPHLFEFLLKRPTVQKARHFIQQLRFIYPAITCYGWE